MEEVDNKPFQNFDQFQELEISVAENEAYIQEIILLNLINFFLLISKL